MLACPVSGAASSLDWMSCVGLARVFLGKRSGYMYGNSPTELASEASKGNKEKCGLLRIAIPAAACG